MCESCHQVICPKCAFKTQATLSKDIKCSAFGPRISAIVAMLTGMYHISRRNVSKLIEALFDIHIALGSISNIEARTTTALQAPVAQLNEVVLQAEVKHTDGSSQYF